MTSEDDPLLAALSGLRGEYLADAPGKMRELWQALERVGNGEPGAAAALRALAHGLAGSGGAYGFPVITEHARAVEQAMDRLGLRRPGASEHDQLRAHLQAIGDAFDQARSPE
jgi:HPt (histidine-containing phosphotransfer) domain-containing protein